MFLTLFIFVLVPLTLYILLFCIETAWSVLRMFRASEAVYFRNTWEITHTLLIFGINSFLWLYSSSIPMLAQRVSAPLLIVATAFLVRAGVYMHLFYIRETRIGGWVFACTNVVLLSGIVTVVMSVFGAIDGGLWSQNTAIVPYLWPGLVVTLSVCAIPMLHVYSAHRKQTTPTPSDTYEKK